MLTALAFVFFSSTAAAPLSSHAAQVATARRVLARAEPRDLTWRYSQHLDINCDHHPDEFFTARDATRFYVAVVLGPITSSSRHSVVAFLLSGHSQDSFCGPFTSLRPEPLASDAHLQEGAVEVPPGYRYSTSCRGLCLTSGECDQFHLFWDHDERVLHWWRL